MLEPFRPLRLSVAAHVLVGAALLSCGRESFANELQTFEELLSRPIARAILGSEQGRAMLQLFAADDASALARALSAPEYGAYRTELERRLREAERLLARSRATDPARAELDADAPLNAGERRLAEWYAERRLRLGSGTVSLAGGESRISGEPIDFTGDAPPSDPRAAFIESEGLFLNPAEPIDLEKLFTRVRQTTEAAARQEGARGVRSFFGQMDDCLRWRTADEEREHFVRYLIGDIAIGEAFTVGGYVSSTGVDNVRLADLTTDIAMTAVTKLVSNTVMRGNIPMRTRWIRATSYKVGRVALDATVYFFNPLADDSTPEAARAHRERTIDRTTYNVMWAVGTSPVTPSTYHMVQGISCLASQFGWRWVGPGTFLARAGIEAGMTVLYFHLRHRYMD